MQQLFEVTRGLLAALPEHFVRAEAHDVEDFESPDVLWLSGDEQSDLCDGDYIAVSPSGFDIWEASHNSAHKVGGHPTLWVMSGTQQQVLKAVSDYLCNDVDES